MPLFFLPLVVSYFNPHSPCGERRSSGSLGFGYRSKFQSTLPLRGATARRTRWCSRNRNFNPHSPCGERPALTVPRWCFSKFQSTLPLRGATRHRMTMMVPTVFQSTLPLRGATPIFNENYRAKLFQSTLPLRGATRGLRRAVHRACHFNPHSPCGERPSSDTCSVRVTYFNPHSPCGERRPYTSSPKYSLLFQSTLPLRGATRPASKRYSANSNFNPHSPCGERRSDSISTSTPNVFQSTLPLRGATSASLWMKATWYFNPHSPCGERPQK